MTTTLGNHPTRPGFAVLAIFAFFRFGHTIDSPAEACEKKEKLQETDETKGIHDFDVCQLVPGIDLPALERPGRICTAHLALIEGHGQVIVPATCFLPAPEQNGIYLQKQEKGWAFNGKLSLTCGPHMYSFDLESTFKDPKVLLHPKFVPEKKFAQLHNFAVVRISREDYAKADAHSAAWEFARLSQPMKEPSADAKCRCYAGTSGAPGGAEPPEYQVERCQFTNDVSAEVKQQTCFRIKQSENPGAAFQELESPEETEECVTKYCGIIQTMACFCGSTADELRKSLYSIGSYVWKKAAGEVSVYSIPLKDNWEFLKTSVHSSSPIGATNAQLDNVQKHLGEAADRCFVQKKGGAEMKKFVKKYLCETADVTADKEVITQEFKDQLKALNDCMNKQTNTPDSKWHELLIPPIEQAVGLAYLVADDKVCAKARIVATAKRLRKKLKRKMRCFALTFREAYKNDAKKKDLSITATFDDIYWKSIITAGLVPGLIGEAIKYGCDKIDPKMPLALAAFRSCMVISTIFLSPAYVLDGVVTGLSQGPFVAPIAIKAAIKATKAAKKVN